MRVILDTDVLVAALRSRSGASNALLRALADGGIEVAVSVPIMLEYEAVLTRPEHLAASGLTRERMSAFLDGLARLVVPVVPHFLWRPQLKDPNDEMILDAAVASGAAAIVTFNRRDFGQAAARLGIEVLTPADLLERLE